MSKQSLTDKIENYINENKKFTMQNLYEEFSNKYKKHSIRARVYENPRVLRTGRGAYVLAGAELEAIIEHADSREHVFHIKKMMIYFDLLFFDIPYHAGGQRGGNRSLINYPTISPEEFKNILTEAEKMLKTEQSQVVFMIAGGKSSIKQSQKYIDCFDSTLLKRHDTSYYTKLNKNGTICNMGKYQLPKELIISYSHSGQDREEIENIKKGYNYEIERPKLKGGYKTEKPLKLLEEIVRRTTLEGERVLDMFTGSGAMLEAAVNLKRKFHGVEYLLDTIEDYIHPRMARLSSTTAKQPTLFDFLA